MCWSMLYQKSKFQKFNFQIVSSPSFHPSKPPLKGNVIYLSVIWLFYSLLKFGIYRLIVSLSFFGGSVCQA